jgi:hypothetical protein
MESHVMSQRLEIKILGSHIRAEGVAGIIGTIFIAGIILAIYLLKLS